MSLILKKIYSHKSLNNILIVKKNYNSLILQIYYWQLVQFANLIIQKNISLLSKKIKHFIENQNTHIKISLLFYVLEINSYTKSTDVLVSEIKGLILEKQLVEVKYTLVFQNHTFLLF